MTTVTSWLRNLGNAGAVANAAQVCDERRRQHQALDQLLLRITPAGQQPAEQAQAS